MDHGSEREALPGARRDARPGTDLRGLARAPNERLPRAVRGLPEAGRHVIVELAGLMAPKVVSWSRDEPFSLHVLLSRFDYPDLYKILMQYVSAVIGVADPLEPRSSDGERSAPEMELGLASLSS